jgi:hypothetical protein
MLDSLENDIHKQLARFLAETNSRNQSRVNTALDKYRKAKEEGKESKKPAKKAADLHRRIL